MTRSVLSVLVFVSFLGQFGCVDAQLYVTDPVYGFIYKIDPTNNAVTRFLETGTSVVGITYDDGSASPLQPATPSLIYSDASGGIYRHYLDNSQSILMYNLSAFNLHADRLDIDPTSGNVYFTTVNHVGVITPSHIHVVLITGLEAGREIVLVPDEGYLFYTDHGSSFPHIGRSFMDNSNWTAIIYTDVVWPNGLSADYPESRLYWSDGSIQKIERCDYDGGNRELLVAGVGRQLMDLLVDGNLIYVTEWSNKTILVYDKTNLNINQIISFSDGIPVGRRDSMAMYSDYSKAKPTNLECAGRYGLGDCSDACLPSSDVDHRCACDYLLSIESDDKTCPDATLCPAIQNGLISPECSRFVYDTCSINCNEGYEGILTELTCLGAEWDVTDPCVDIDECAQDISVCSQICTNTVGSFQCSCDDGFILSPSDSSSCFAVEPCTSAPCRHVCTNIPGGYECSCSPSYTPYAQDRHLCVAIQADIRVTLNVPFVEELLDSQSSQFSQMASQVIHTIDTLVNRSPLAGSYLGCHVNSFSPGSIVTNAATSFNTVTNVTTSFNASTTVDDEYITPENISSAVDNSGNNTDESLTPMTSPPVPTDFRGLDECASDVDNNCQHICVDRIFGYGCLCYEGYIVRPTKRNECQDVNECSEGTDDCHQQCNNTDGRYNCSCIEGFSIDPANSSHCVDVNECSEGTNDCNQQCENLEGGYGCSCNDGFSIDPTDSSNCIDVNECSEGTHDCNQTCTNNVGSYSCSCNEGFSTDPTDSSNCIDINECSEETVDCNQQCDNSIGSYSCSCNDGFSLGPTGSLNCIDVNECSEGTNDCNQTCTNNVGSYSCSCNEGFSTDPTDSSNCIDVNECLEGTNDCNQQCINNVGSYSCSCNRGFSTDPRDSSNCIDINECQLGSNACEQTCDNFDGGYTCGCENGYFIDPTATSRCRDVDECAQRRCGVSHCTNSPGSFSCSCNNGYVPDRHDPTKCRVPLLQYGPPAGDSDYRRVDDGCTGPMVFPDDVPIFSYSFKNLYPCTNGLASIDRPYTNYYPSGNRDSYLAVQIFAPLFTDIDFRNGGAVFYNHYSKLSRNAKHRENIAAIQRYIREMVTLTFDAEYLAVVTWSEGRRYYGYSGRPTATFQLALVTDWTTTYLVYIYGEDQMKWVASSGTPKTLIGYILAGGVHKEISLFSFTEESYRMDQFAETNDVKGIIVYTLSGDSGRRSSSTTCNEWYNNVKDVQDIRRGELLQCPCTLQLLQQANRFFYEEYNNVARCFVTWSRWRTRPNAMRCCYDRAGDWISRNDGPGGFIYYHPQQYSFLYSKFDESPRIDCCQRSSTCALYRELRPVGQCFTRTPSSFADLFGDPHIVTLDGRTYTFNGWGEYTLLSVITPDEEFVLQGRTERAVTLSGRTTDATIFTAFAAMDHTNATLHVEIDEIKTGLILYGDGIDLSTDFNNYERPFNYTGESMILYRVNETLVVLFTSIDMSLRIRIDIGMLGVSLRVPESLRGLTSGLLGNYDADPDNEYTFPDGSTLSPNATEKELFPFGQSWMVAPNETIFRYFDRLNYHNYSHPDFVPRFLEDENQEVVANATSFCGENNLACIYDLVMTDIVEIAVQTNTSEKNGEQSIALSKNDIPVLNGSRVIHSYVGEEVTVYVEAYDEGAVEFSLTGDAVLSNVTDKSAIVTWVPDSSSIDPVSVTARDSLGMSSVALNFDIVLCNNCSGHGYCDYTTIAEGYSSVSYYPLARCNCDHIEGIPIWSGLACENDFDGCSTHPCSIGQTCVDLNVTEHWLQQRGHQCGPCPQGFEDDGIKCSDIDECVSANNNVCEQICVNTEASFYCMCETGYRSRPENQSRCEDVNECEEAMHQCEHKCTNTAGSYNCSCFAGYKLNEEPHSCVRDSEIDECELIGLNCSKTAGCTNESGVPECFCASGYELNSDGTECSNINECRRNVCPQKCRDTDGGFNCSCYAGYKLQDDSVSCKECDSIHWGNNCENTCICGRGTDSCDNVHGCLCRDGWTGSQCNTDVDECQADSNLCNGDHQICHNTPGSFFCTCEEGYQLAADGSCEDIDECVNLGLNECQQKCLNTPGSFVCSCREGYIVDAIDQTQCKDLDECEAGIATCEQICENVPSKFNCDCYFGYVLNTDRITCRKVDDLCSVFGGVNCSHICVLEQTTVRCDCPLGYELGSDSQTCKDIDECASSLLNKCSEPDLCINLLGGYECSCRPGKFLQNDRRTCTACDSYHYGDNCAEACNCGKGADHCDPVRGCVCNTGWIGKQCDIDLDECDGNRQICPEDNSICVNKPGGFSCKCQSGYNEDVSGKCKDINECISPLLNTCDQICVNTNGGFVCRCQPGFSFANDKCSDIDECAGPHDCQQLCSNTVGSYRCSCHQGFRLELTERKKCSVIDECDSSQKDVCHNRSADCSILNFNPNCVCWKGFHGNANEERGCEDFKECDQTPSPCEHICVEQSGGFNCSCRPGFYIDKDMISCTECIDGTWGDNCGNTCRCSPSSIPGCNKENGVCKCKSGFKGPQCEEDIDECFENTVSCPDNSVCENAIGSFICVCQDGYLKSADGRCSECDGDHWGPMCSQECSCVGTNTAKCDNVHGTCQCRPGWTSEYCSVDYDECVEDDPCSADEICQNKIGSYKCTCKAGFIRDEMRGCIDIDECKFGLHSCSHDCINTEGGFTCKCPDGFMSEDDNCLGCPQNTFGNNCVGICDCNTTNVLNTKQSCDLNTGLCLCKPEWQGATCNDDVDECKTGTHTCDGAQHHVCRNSNGGYDCICSPGYQTTDDNTCEVPPEAEPLKTGVIIGISVIGGVAILALVALTVVCCRRGRGRDDLDRRYYRDSGDDASRFPKMRHSTSQPNPAAGINQFPNRFKEADGAQPTGEWRGQSLDNRISIPRASVNMQFPIFQSHVRKPDDYTFM